MLPEARIWSNTCSITPLARFSKRLLWLRDSSSWPRPATSTARVVRGSRPESRQRDHERRISGDTSSSGNTPRLKNFSRATATRSSRACFNCGTAFISSSSSGSAESSSADALLWLCSKK